jgi:hypothetical protein
MNRDSFAMEYSLDEAREQCLSAIRKLGWQLRHDMTDEDRIVCYVPIPNLLPQAPVYFVSLYALDSNHTQVVLIAADDDLSQAHADQDIARLNDAINSPSRSTVGESTGAAQIARQSEQGYLASGQGKCFISYRRHDSADAAGRIYDRLVARYGHDRIFKDVDNIPLGSDFRKVIGEAVSGCVVLLAIIGREWLTVGNEHGQRRIDDPTDFVRIEIEIALQRNIPVIPLLVRDASMPHASALPECLREMVYRNGIQVRSDPDFHRDMERLLQALDKLLEP